MQLITRPSFVGGRSLNQVLELNRWKEADIDYGIYIKPEGSRGLHVIGFPCSNEEIVVGSILVGTTFAPGTIVPIGNNSGSEGKFILSSPPPGRRGAANFPVLTKLTVLNTPSVDKLNPFNLNPGFSGIVQILGSGFTQSPENTFKSVIYDETLLDFIDDVDISIVYGSFVSTERVDVIITVSLMASRRSINIDVV